MHDRHFHVDIILMQHKIVHLRWSAPAIIVLWKLIKYAISCYDAQRGLLIVVISTDLYNSICHLKIIAELLWQQVRFSSNFNENNGQWW